MIALTLTACAPQLEIELTLDPVLPGPPDFVKLQFLAVGDTAANEFGPFDVDTVPPEQFTPTTPDTPFYIDVMGCPKPEVEACVDEISFNARGCTEGLITLGRDESKTVTIVLHDRETGAQICPPSIDTF